MSSSPQIADAEALFMVVNVTPDFCVVQGQVVPFEIYQLMPPEKEAYSPDVFSRGEKVLPVDSVISGVIGNMGEGIVSTVSQADGHTVLTEGEESVLVNDRPIVRHGHACVMNVKV